MTDFERCTCCECRGHLFDGDLPHTTMGCPLCGTCEVCAECDYDGPERGCDRYSVPSRHHYLAPDDYPEELQTLRELLDEMYLALARAEGVLALDLEAGEAPAPWERRELQTRYREWAGALSVANLRFALAVKARWEALGASGGVLPVEVGPGAAP